YRNIDILIANNKTKQAIIIENKIWARDQPKQLERYSDIAKEENYKKVQRFYLTVFGNEPSDDSRGVLKKEQIKNISYSVEIFAWINRCMELSVRNNHLLNALNQYHDVVA